MYTVTLNYINIINILYSDKLFDVKMCISYFDKCEWQQDDAKMPCINVTLISSVKDHI